MTNTNTTKIVEQFLSLVPQFNRLSPEAIANIAPKLKPLRFGVGKVMIMREKMQGQVAIISEGEVRPMLLKTSSSESELAECAQLE